jgi:hypothetical protein
VAETCPARAVTECSRPPRPPTTASGGNHGQGIVAKRKDAPYRSDARSGWIKLKTAEWKAANQFRAKLFGNATDLTRNSVSFLRHPIKR